jgi:hypothetical protein
LRQNFYHLNVEKNAAPKNWHVDPIKSYNASLVKTYNSIKSIFNFLYSLKNILSKNSDRIAPSCNWSGRSISSLIQSSR